METKTPPATRWIACSDGSIATAKEVEGLAVHNYHKEMLGLAQEAIGRFSPEERHFLALTVCIPPHKLAVLKQELNDMGTRLFDLCDTNNDDPKIALQLHLHYFPLSNTEDPS